MLAQYDGVAARVEKDSQEIAVALSLRNASNQTWQSGAVLGYQLYDPETGRFLAEGEWQQLGRDLPPDGTMPVTLRVLIPRQPGRYHVYLSPLLDGVWLYTRGDPFVLLDVQQSSTGPEVLATQVTTLGGLHRSRWWPNLRFAITAPWTTVWQHRRLIRSMVKRDILARYRGSFGDFFWTLLHPLLLMGTYFFVFGVVLQTRFGPNPSRWSFTIYFLAAMLPWLAFSEAVGRAPWVVLENRNLVKKLVFPLETLPLNAVASGLVTQAFGTAVFLLGLALSGNGIPLSVLWLPVLLIPQLLLTAGLTWLLSATSVFLRDLGQIIGFVLTLWFFLTPICYPASNLPASVLPILQKNPIFGLVEGYRTIFLSGQAPPWPLVLKLWLLSIALCVAGRAWFERLKKSFADVI